MKANADEILFFETSAEWERWLEKHHQSAPGAWVRFAKAKSGKTCVAYADALELALCFGWIDALRHGDGPDFYLQRFTPRKPRSLWSLINRNRALALIKAGKMRPAGLLEIERAKANGRWKNAYGGRQTIKILPEFAAALKASPKAKATFETLNGQNRFAFLFRLQNTLKPGARSKRVEAYIAMLERGETIYPQAAKKPAAKKKASARKSRKAKPGS